MTRGGASSQIAHSSLQSWAEPANHPRRARLSAARIRLKRPSAPWHSSTSRCCGDSSSGHRDWSARASPDSSRRSARADWSSILVCRGRLAGWCRLEREWPLPLTVPHRFRHLCRCPFGYVAAASESPPYHQHGTALPTVSSGEDDLLPSASTLASLNLDPPTGLVGVGDS